MLLKELLLYFIQDLKKVIPGTEFTLEQGIIVYGYDQNGLNLEGLSKADKDAILKYISSKSNKEKN